jgi:hypothetical protein
MVLSIIFLEDKHKILLHSSIFYEYQQFFQHRIIKIDFDFPIYLNNIIKKKLVECAKVGHGSL